MSIYDKSVLYLILYLSDFKPHHWYQYSVPSTHYRVISISTDYTQKKLERHCSFARSSFVFVFFDLLSVGMYMMLTVQRFAKFGISLYHYKKKIKNDKTPNFCPVPESHLQYN